AAAGYAASQVVALATVAAKAAEPGLAGAARALGVPLRSFPAEALAAVRGPEPCAAAGGARRAPPRGPGAPPRGPGAGGPRGARPPAA
ncbi:cobalamin biosynthesis protein, partial [Streptomyces decoyicus]